MISPGSRWAKARPRFGRVTSQAGKGGSPIQVAKGRSRRSILSTPGSSIELEGPIQTCFARRNVTVIVSQPGCTELTSFASCPVAGEHVFAYGSLVDPLCLDDVLGHRHRGERLRARLDGYRRVSIETYEFPFIVAAPESSVEGVLLMDLSPADMHAVDGYEDVDIGTYVRERVEVEVWGCGPRTLRLQAYAYVGGQGLLAALPG
jgi:hypothetical protein